MDTVLEKQREPVKAGADRLPVYAFVGNPNCGKTTIFNALTGLKQKVGNYPGVTVEKKTGEFYSQHGKPVKIIDLPGAYSLAARSPDEAVLRDVLLGRRRDTERPDRVVCIVDASNLERNFYLLMQVLDLGMPVIVALNMMDIAAESGLEVQIGRLEKLLGVPVVACEANSGKGLTELRLVMSRAELPVSNFEWKKPEKLTEALRELQSALVGAGRSEGLAAGEALLLLTEPDPLKVTGSIPLEPGVVSAIEKYSRMWEAEDFDWRGTLVSARYDAITLICQDVVSRNRNTGPSLSDRIDAWVVHPWWGWLILGVIMSVMFLSIFTLAEYPMDLIDQGFAAVSTWVKGVMPAGDFRDLLTDGVIGGAGGVIIFLPQILILFFFIGLLEATGYMARAAFIMDRLMSRVGLNGKSFIPLLSSYACAIPGIMATRTIEDTKDRLVTILVAPLMSCSARLPVYLLLIAALIPNGRMPVFEKVGIMVGLYFLGTAAAFGFAWLFKRFLLRGEAPLMIMELPSYRLPSLRTVAMHMLERAMIFLKRAGTIILGISIILWFLTTYPKSPDAANATQAVQHSFAGQIGQVLQPIIKPLGFDWRIGVGLVASFAAREVFVSSMGVVFSVDSDANTATVPLHQKILAAHWPDGHPLFTPLVCISLLVYYVFAMQCMSTVAVVRRETNSWRWPLFQIFYMTGTAYVLSFLIFQGGRLLGF